MEDWSGTVYGPTTPRPRKKAAARLPAGQAATKGAASTSGTPAAPAKRTPRKTVAAAKPPTDVLEVALTDADQPEAVPAPRSADAPAGIVSRPAAPTPPSTPLWTLLVADPRSAPEHLAREAVRWLGPAAQEWVDRTRERYPGARTDALARLAAEEHIRIARRQALANTTAFGSLAEVGLLGRTHARLVLIIAAVYGADPTAEDRVRDLMDLLPFPRLTRPLLAAAGDAGRLLGAVAVRRAGARLIPFGASIAGYVHSGRTTEVVALRAIARFRPRC